MSSFDDVEINNCAWKAHSDDYYRGYEAGAQSRQSEVDELKKRIDGALKVLNDASPTMLNKKAIKILKGENHES